MDSSKKGILSLVRSGVTGERIELPYDFDLESVYDVAVNHQILPIVYIGAVQCGIDKSTPVMRKMFAGYCRHLAHSEGQMREVERVCQAFDDAEIDYMPLKGCRLKYIYPKPELRVMGDADILIRTEQYEKIRGVMEGLGFSRGKESDHELIWKTDALTLELHKRLIPSYNKDYYAYFGDGWKLAEYQEGNLFEMREEDEYMYLFTHFAKHYRDGGIGVRHVTDLWVYMLGRDDLDAEYIKGELKKLQLYEFYQNICELIAFWFGDAAGNEKCDFITDFIFKSGAWGKHDVHVVSAGAKNAREGGSIAAGKVKQAMKMLFPPFYVMRQKYALLSKAPILLPAFWVVRWITGLLLRRDNVRTQKKHLTDVSAEQIKSYQQALDYVGLDFCFKE